MAQLKTKIRWFLRGLVLAAVLGLVLVLAERVLPRLAIAQIAELTNTKISAELIDFDFDGSVFIEKLVITPHQKHAYDSAILKAETVHVRFGIGSLLLLRPRLKEINVNDFVLNAQQDLDTGRWNIAALKIKPRKAGRREMPLIRLAKGMLQYTKVLNGQSKVVTEIPIDARFGPAEETQDGYRFKVTTARIAGIFGRSTLSGSWRPGQIIIAGGISSTDVPAFERGWEINVLAAELNYDQSNAYSLKLRIRDLFGTPSRSPDAFALVRPSFLEKSTPFTALQKFFTRFRPWGKIDIALDASGNLDRLSESTLSGRVYCKDVSIHDRKFPYEIKRLTGRIDFTKENILLNNLSGEHGDVKLAINGWARGFGPNCRYQIRITSNNMALDDDLYNALSAKRKKFWQLFSPGGIAEIDYHISRQSQTDKKITLAVELLGVEATYRRFPYPLKNLTGTLLFDRDSITISDVISQLNERKITINGKITARRTDRPIYDISIKANNIPLNSALAEALPDNQSRYYEQFDMAGLADADVKIFTPKQDSGPTSFIADVSFRKMTLKINELAPIISDVSGKAVFTPDLIRIQNLTGRYGEGLVSLTGRIWPGRKAEQPPYSLLLNAEQVVLNDELFSLLPRPLEKIISESQPKGKVNINADLNKADNSDLPDYKITVDCLGNSISFKQFPYPLKDIRGSLTITKDSIKLQSITATADDVQVTQGGSTIKVNGQITLVNNVFSEGNFALCANDIFLDEQLGVALPEDIQPFYSKLSPTGRFDLELENIKIFNAETSGKYIDFVGTAKLKACNFNASVPVTELNAELKTKGLYKTGDGLRNANATLIADGLRIKGKALTGLKANIDYDNDRRNWLSENFIADCYGGRLIGRFELKSAIGGPKAALEYLLQTGFDDIDLKWFLSDEKPKETRYNGYTSGQMSGSLGVRGRIADNHSRIGRCRLIITDMQVGKLSPLAKLLNVLKLTEPKDFAFDQMLVDSYIKHNRLFFQQLDLSGEALAFNGSGWMDLRDSNVDLTLTARGRRATAEPSILQSLTEGLGIAVMRMEITGSVYDPQVETKTLPVIEDSLQILGTKQTTPD